MAPSVRLWDSAPNSTSLPQPFRQFSDEDYAQYCTARTAVLGFSNQQDLLLAAVRSLREFTRLTELFLTAFLQGTIGPGASMKAMGREINQSVLSLLSAVRTYLDHTDARLKRTYGAGSAQVAAFDTRQEKRTRRPLRVQVRLRPEELYAAQRTAH
jgi:hypothetical protein